MELPDLIHFCCRVGIAVLIVFDNVVKVFVFKPFLSYFQSPISRETQMNVVLKVLNNPCEYLVPKLKF